MYGTRTIFNRNVQRNITLIAFLLFLSLPGFGQDLSARLNQTVATFDSKASTTVGQLIDLAQRHHLPMGIEWLYSIESRAEPPAKPVHLNEHTINKIIQTILQARPEYTFEVRDGVIHIYPRSFTRDRRNFLNLQIPQVNLKDENLFGVSYFLRVSIKQLLHPRLGHNGGYGYDPQRNDGFDLPKVSIDAGNLSVRQVLSLAVSRQGNALWLAYLNPAQLANETYDWQFIALNPHYVGK